MTPSKDQKLPVSAQEPVNGVYTDEALYDILKAKKDAENWTLRQLAQWWTGDEAMFGNIGWVLKGRILTSPQVREKLRLAPVGLVFACSTCGKFHPTKKTCPSENPPKKRNRFAISGTSAQSAADSIISHKKQLEYPIEELVELLYAQLEEWDEQERYEKEEA